tara:strand:+ start:61 stop:324 length:264 start_codon:yes stop_codon:yes gene_type:complete
MEQAQREWHGVYRQEIKRRDEEIERLSNEQINILLRTRDLRQFGEFLSGVEERLDAIQEQVDKIQNNRFSPRENSVQREVGFQWNQQ